MSIGALLEPIGWFAFFIGCMVIANFITTMLSSLGSKGKGKLQTKAGMVISLLVVAILWFVFSEQIADLFSQVQAHAVQVIALLLVVIAILIYFKKGN